MWLIVCSMYTSCMHTCCVADLFVTAEPYESMSKGWTAAPANGSSGILSQRSCTHFLSDSCAIIIIKIQSIEALSRMVGFVVLHLHLEGHKGVWKNCSRFVGLAWLE